MSCLTLKQSLFIPKIDVQQQLRAVEDNPCHHVTISMGVAYVEFFAKYPHYFNFLFDSENLGIQIKETEITWNRSFTPFEIFVNGAKRGMRELRQRKTFFP